MKVIGITGASGSGKTTISEILNKRPDTKIIDADKLAKSLTLNQTEYFEEIKEKFAKDNILLENGKLNRKKLANLIYKNDEKLEMLNKITFKHLIPKILEEINNVDKNIQIVVIDAPLLFEAGLEKYCDIVIAIQASDELKIKRICIRDNISEDMAKNRLKIQKNNEFYSKKADFIIENNEMTNEKDLERQVIRILEKVLI